MPDDTLISQTAKHHAIFEKAVRMVLSALVRGGGRMAQFSHQDFGGMSQWSPGMTMVGDMFNDSLKAKLNAVCDELAKHLESSPSTDASISDVSYRSPRSNQWWPDDLGAAGSVGAQNDMAYAVFPSTRRLAIRDGDKVMVYDTGDHDIHSVPRRRAPIRHSPSQVRMAWFGWLILTKRLPAKVAAVSTTLADLTQDGFAYDLYERGR